MVQAGNGGERQAARRGGHMLGFYPDLLEPGSPLLPTPAMRDAPATSPTSTAQRLQWRRDFQMKEGY